MAVKKLSDLNQLSEASANALIAICETKGAEAKLITLANLVNSMTKNTNIADVLAGLLPIATATKNGLMKAGGFQFLGDLGNNDLKNIGSGFGYAYADNDGSGVSGIFLSFEAANSKIQFKANFYNDNILLFRKYNQINKVWTGWMTINVK